MFGSSTIVIAIEAIRQSDGRYLAYTDNGREHTGIEVVSWAKHVEDLGAGEIIITSVDNEGTGEGFDLELIELCSYSVSIPLIVHGGFGKPKDIKSALFRSEFQGVAISSSLHYQLVKGMENSINNSHEGNFEFLNSGNSFSKIHSYSINEIKNYLVNHEIQCRL